MAKTNKRTTKAATPAQAAKSTPVVTTTGGNMRMQEPGKSSKRRASRPRVVTVVGQTDDVLIDQVSGFANFLRDYGVVGLAIGFIAGQQANAVIKQLVASFVDPLVKIWLGQDLSSRQAIFHHAGQEVKVPWGAFLYTLLDFFIILIAVYLVVKLFKLDRLKKIDPAVAAAAAANPTVVEVKK